MNVSSNRNKSSSSVVTVVTVVRVVTIVVVVVVVVESYCFLIIIIVGAVEPRSLLFFQNCRYFFWKILILQWFRHQLRRRGSCCCSVFIWHVCFFEPPKISIFRLFFEILITRAPRPGGSFGALAADFSKSCDCRTSALRLLGAPSAGASVVVALRKDYISDGVCTFFVHWPCLRLLLIFAMNFQLIFYKLCIEFQSIFMN